ncbi:AAC(3) family N-acetyltransferase [Actinoplanes derwentensis]|uniref:Aminoglycoside N(3)-acetyltransferase n=1 Tax=Actinoplanes derwentensis TaxID=113562 RepID=A0A1H2C4I6_9ACTN|nr:AAC(3) family N-acetyltransferase [Actinoplanes derwentensis]GID84170.1 AAC(3) family N-acetyltransferase [Actinoplanes derwentensis]SDT65252.1 aminoglycoside 3-N-acetyltransferase [Actinoplanes derwentensis]
MTGEAVTHDDLVAGLTALGLPEGGLLLVHCSMRRIGRVDGGAATLLAALRTVGGPAVTIVVPAQTPDNSLTSPVYRTATAGMTGAERARYVAGMPGFDPDHTPSYGVGVFAEQIRSHPGALRSRHPQTSFAALGPEAAAVVAVHDLDCHLGERSPLGTLYRRHAMILMLGAGMAKCTALHLAEYRLGGPVPTMDYSCFMSKNGQRIPLRFSARKLNDSDFQEAGNDILRHSWAITGQVGGAEAHLLPLAPAVDQARRWFSTSRRINNEINQ